MGMFQRRMHVYMRAALPMRTTFFGHFSTHILQLTLTLSRLVSRWLGLQPPLLPTRLRWIRASPPTAPRTLRVPLAIKDHVVSPSRAMPTPASERQGLRRSCTVITSTPARTISAKRDLNVPMQDQTPDARVVHLASPVC